MVVIPPSIILVSQEPGLFEMDENTFCRTEHSGTRNLSLLPKAQNLWFLNPISMCFLPYTLCNKIQTKNNGNAYVWWIEKRLHGDSDFLYLKKKFKILSKVPAANVVSMHHCCALAFLWDVSLSQWPFILERHWHSERLSRWNRTQTQTVSLWIHSGHWSNDSESFPYDSSKKKKFSQMLMSSGGRNELLPNSAEDER